MGKIKDGDQLAQAIVLVSTETSMRVDEDTLREVSLEEIFDRIAGMEGTREIAEVTGPYDLVVWIEADHIEEITGPMVDKIRALEGVRKTLTNVVVRSK